MDSTSVNKILASAMLRILRPLVRILLRNGISYGLFSDWVKWVYVDVAEKEFTVPGRKQSMSRVAVLTGINRKEVARVKSLPVPDDTHIEEAYNRAARVIGGWITDKEFLDQQNHPLSIEFDAGANSFSTLVRRYSGDVPARAVLDELLRVEAVAVDKDLKISLLSRGYVPSGDESSKLHTLGTDVADLVTTIDYNLCKQDDVSRFQRKVSYDNLPSNVIEEFKNMSSEKSQQLLEELNRWLVVRDRDSNADVVGEGRKRAGISIYYFEEDISEGEEDDVKD